MEPVQASVIQQEIPVKESKFDGGLLGLIGINILQRQRCLVLFAAEVEAHRVAHVVAVEEGVQGGWKLDHHREAGQADRKAYHIGLLYERDRR